MRHSPLCFRRRLFAPALLIALLSAVLLGGAQEAACQMHGLGAALVVEPPSDPGHDHGDAAATGHHSGSRESDRGDRGCDCSCIGACTMSAPVATPPTAVTLRIASVLSEPIRQIGVAQAQAPREVDRLLPYANGPPTSALA